MKKILIWRWTFYFVGLFIASLGVSMTIKGYLLGIGPWDVFHVGLYQNFGLTIGSWSIISGLVIVLITALATREWPKIGTWINMVLFGVFIDFFNWLIPDFATIGAQAVVFVLGIVILACGMGIYIAPNMGAGPRDSLMLLFVDKFGISIKKVRTIIEVVVACAGWLLGGPVGIGTVLIALFIGQVVHYSLPKSRALLMKIIGETEEQVLF